LFMKRYHFILILIPERRPAVIANCPNNCPAVLKIFIKFNKFLTGIPFASPNLATQIFLRNFPFERRSSMIIPRGPDENRGDWLSGDKNKHLSKSL
jgi:hypothetical protein